MDYLELDENIKLKSLQVLIDHNLSSIKWHYVDQRWMILNKGPGVQ